MNPKKINLNTSVSITPFALLKKILAKDSSLFWISAVYGLAIALLSLAIPISVQLLINSVSFTAMMQPIVALGILLLTLLSIWALLSAFQFLVTEIFQSRFFVRIASEIAILLTKSKQQGIDKSSITNHFFETIAIQKTIPKFLTKTFSTFLQGFIGLILVSFYHPVFFLFSIVICLSLWAIWSNFSEKAIAGSFSKSRIKYDIVRSFGEINSSSDNGYLEKINSLSGDYLRERKLRFRSLFIQVILLLSLYVLSSVVLLVVGGWLILKGQLTLGQLVAAELILSVTLYNFSQLGRDLENFYDLIASCQKLSQFYDHTIEKKDFLPFSHFRKIRTPRPLKVLLKIILVFLLGASLMLCLTPWRQTSKGFGNVIATDPNDRAQDINAPIDGRIKKWYVRDGSQIKKGDKIVEIVDNDPLILERIKSERDAKKRKLEVARIASQTAKINYQRQEELFAKGLSSRRDYEEAKIEYKKLLGIEASADSDLAESETKLSRQENQILTAPQDGVILKVLAGDSATTVKAGHKIATFAPNLSDPAVEIYVSGNDIPLINEGRKVRLQFEGWPIIQFSGWPSIAIGTFGGVVSSVDSSVSENGKFRVIVKQDQNEKWPDQRFLRHGAKSQAWILLNKVSLGYEMWRQLNSFPPKFDEELKNAQTKNNSKNEK